MLIAYLKLIPRPNNRESIIEILRSVISLIKGKPGCMGCAIYEEDSRDRPIIYMEQWESKESLQQHIQSRIYSMILNAMELASEPPGVKFHEVSETMGLEFIEAMRLS